MSKSILTVVAVAAVTTLAACDRNPVETPAAAVVTAPTVQLSTEPVYTGKYK